MALCTRIRTPSPSFIAALGWANVAIAIAVAVADVAVDVVIVVDGAVAFAPSFASVDDSFDGGCGVVISVAVAVDCCCCCGRRLRGWQQYLGHESAAAALALIRYYIHTLNTHILNSICKFTQYYCNYYLHDLLVIVN